MKGKKNMLFNIHYSCIPILSIGFTRSTSVVGRTIQLVRGILSDPAAPNHAFITTEDHGQLFATEETWAGLRENSLEQYAKKTNRIVAMYSWRGFTDPEIHKEVCRYLARIRRKNLEESCYDRMGLLTFVPGIGRMIKADPKKQWCSENVASILKYYGCPCIEKTTLAPDELLSIIRENRDEFTAVLNYYL